MNLRIRWTAIALQSLSEVFEYTFEEFGEHQLRKLLNKVYTVVRRVAAFPQSGKLEEEISTQLGTEYRSVVVIREIKLFYTIDCDTIFVEYVKNTRLSDATMLVKLSES